MYKIIDLQKLISDEIEKEMIRINETSPNNLYQPIAYALGMGGKRIRPLMLLLAANLFTDQIKQAMPSALAIEVFHNFTLLHDDIMDQAELRRNAQSVYTKYNQNIAILSGDAMSILAYQYLQKSETGKLSEMIHLFSNTAIEVCEGQQFDMDFETRMDVTISEYLNMIRLKTAVLLACSLQLGAMAANAPQTLSNLLYVFGLNLGMAFQLQDDLMDVYADQEKFGKKIGGDIIANKKTFLMLKALELSDIESRAILFNWFEKTDFNPNEKIEAVKAIYEKLNVKAITENLIADFYDSAINILQEIDVNLSAKSELMNLAQMIMGRKN
jgi:geranylgeranyl diphosphate synthase type II